MAALLIFVPPDKFPLIPELARPELKHSATLSGSPWKHSLSSMQKEAGLLFKILINQWWCLAWKHWQKHPWDIDIDFPSAKLISTVAWHDNVHWWNSLWFWNSVAGVKRKTKPNQQLDKSKQGFPKNPHPGTQETRDLENTGNKLPTPTAACLERGFLE